MLIVGIDTSWKEGGIALGRGDERGFALIEMVAVAGGTFSAQLVPQLAALLEKHGFRKRDIEGIAVASGPGSFTGLRVGLAAVKGLVEILKTPIAAVSVLEALALGAGSDGKFVAVLDAGRGELYAGQYQIVGSRAARASEALWKREELLSHLASGVIVVTPDTSIAELAQSGAAAVQVVERPRADAIARIGTRKILDRETVSVERLDANYVRRSDAEIFSRKALSD